MCCLITCVFHQKCWQQQRLRLGFQGLQIWPFTLENHGLLSIFLHASSCYQPMSKKHLYIAPLPAKCRRRLVPMQ